MPRRAADIPEASGAMDILVTGGSGQVGLELQRFTWPRAAKLHAPGRDALDLSNLAAIAEIVASRPWAAVVNAGAYTAVDKAENDVAAAWTLNALRSEERRVGKECQ